MDVKDNGVSWVLENHVSWVIRDAWLVCPPCELSTPYCHKDCPYYYECNGYDDPDDDILDQ